MRVEISQELDADDLKLDVPWESPADPSVRYVDLKQCPAAIPDLPECRKYPELASLLREVNCPGSFLATVKCDAWSTRDLAEDEKLDFPEAVKLGSYVDLIVEDSRLARDQEAHRALAREIVAGLRDVKVKAQMEVVIRRCFFRAFGDWGYAMTLFLHAYGQNEEAAREQWAHSLQALSNALARIIRRQHRGAGA